MNETMEAKCTGLGLWWSMVGKWQTLMVVITLAIFFTILQIIGGEMGKVIFAVATTTFVIALITPALSAIVAALSATSVAIFTIIIPAVIATIFAVITVFVAIAVVFTLAYDEDKNINISKKTLQFSYVAEFVVILLPILGTILNWW
ncbi:hypothetical protein AUJ78_00090 [Candidatus Peregrinibacteria bacterium CG1_02_41_10]|nr:MAG: hypothetical protein AUJ78_00090 [Candidatus Peregrinibacteria bacterium CG1_02_41_10]